MKEYDYIIVGAGTAGLGIAFKAAETGAKVALIDKNLIGGTCHNTGCVPSKSLIYWADLIMAARRAKDFGLGIEIRDVDFGMIMEKMRNYQGKNRRQLEELVRETEHLDYYCEQARFTGAYTMDVGGETLSGRKIFVASGSRNRIPAITGADSVPYLTNESLLDLVEKPGSILIIGGGYIAVEYAHFFSSVGTRVTILEEGERLVSHEEPEISELLRTKMEKRMEIHTGILVKEMRKEKTGSVVKARQAGNGNEWEFQAEKILIAIGRQSNADLLAVEKTGIETDDKGYVKVNDSLETNVPGIWAVGDAIDKLMFTHSADRESEIAWHNATNSEKKRMDFNSVPHAVYSYPRIASAGLTQQQAANKYETLVGVARYSDVLKGDIMGEDSSFAKAVVEKQTGKILGFHIIGPEAPLLIQEVVNVMATGGTIEDITAGIHIFPALSELIPETLSNLKEVREKVPA